MNSIKKVQKALADLDKLVLNLEQAQEACQEEVNKNDDKITNTLTTYVKIVALIRKVKNFITDKRNKRIEKLEESNKQLIIAQERAARVKARIENIIK